MTLARLTAILCATVFGAGIATAGDLQTASRPFSEAPTASDVMNADASVLAGSIPVDTPVAVSNTEVVCTGIGEEMENDARWNAYPVKLQFAAASGHWLADEKLTVSQNGQTIANFKCMGPIVLMDLPAGNYQLSADVPGAGAKQISFSVPSRGQHEVTVQFPVQLAQATNNSREADQAYNGETDIETQAATPAPTNTAARPEEQPEDETTEQGGAY